ncbi:MAG: hypothetical protein R3B72_10635 [Polyangiaceae bacterium]
MRRAPLLLLAGVVTACGNTSVDLGAGGEDGDAPAGSGGHAVATTTTTTSGVGGAGGGIPDWTCHDGAVCDFPLEVGTGVDEEHFVLAEPGAEVTLIQGPQGGYHIWIGYRCRDCTDQHLVTYGLRDPTTGEWSYLGEPLTGIINLDPGPDGSKQRPGLYGLVSGAEVAGQPLLLDVFADDQQGHQAQSIIEVIPSEPVPWDCPMRDPEQC